ncbi:Glycosyl hydrolase 1 family protein [Aspergillus niger]|uniref:Glycosyl hydrolase 1 family protein n=1 Tax=Aspergillus niger TaxID=5061 RepID=A0A505HVG5_ASPNG|nr:Glycosyl hydrolase 1 family protein [Aspergillus niger]
MTLQDMPQDKESLNVIELLKAHVKTLEEQCHKAQEERLKAWEECDKARKERNESSKNAVETIEKVNRDAAELRKENQELKAELSKVQGWRNLFEQPATKNSGTAKEKNDRKPKIRRKGRADRYGPNRIERSVYPEFTFTPSPPPPDPGPACSFATPPSDPSQNLNLNIAKLEHTHDGELQSGNKTEAGREPRPKKRVRFELDTCPEEPTAEGIPSSRVNAPYPDPEWKPRQTMTMRLLLVASDLQEHWQVHYLTIEPFHLTVHLTTRWSHHHIISRCAQTMYLLLTLKLHAAFQG